MPVVHGADDPFGMSVVQQGIISMTAHTHRCRENAFHGINGGGRAAPKVLAWGPNEVQALGNGLSISEPSSAEKLAFLGRPAAYRHTPPELSTRESHVSWLFLAGDRVYKLKKPVRLLFSAQLTDDTACRAILELALLVLRERAAQGLRDGGADLGGRAQSKWEKTIRCAHNLLPALVAASAIVSSPVVCPSPRTGLSRNR